MTLEHVHISRGNTKLGADIPSVNLPAGCTCREDAPCFKKCYARKGRFSFPHNRELVEMNLRLWHDEPVQYMRDVMVAAFKSKFFRWHSSGDIPDAEYLQMMVDVANTLPDTRFLCFTKKHEIVNAYIEGSGDLPANLSVVFSAWGDWQPENPFGLPVAYIRFRKDQTDIPADAYQCPKYCGDCVMSGCSCWDLKRGFRDDNSVDCVVFDEHYDNNTNELLDSFVPARAWDFWGICWEDGTHRIWIQSADIGIYCYELQNGHWVLNKDIERPDTIVSKWGS